MSYPIIPHWYNKRVSNPSELANIAFAYRRYCDSKWYSVEDAYSSPSYAKICIERSILQDMYSIKGFDYRIVAKNCNIFTCAYRVESEDEEYFVYITPSYARIVKISQILTGVFEEE